MSSQKRLRNSQLRAQVIAQLWSSRMSQVARATVRSERSATSRHALGQRRVGILAIACLGLLLSGSPSMTHVLPDASASITASLDASSVAAVLEQVNPTLAPREIDRMAAAVVRYSAAYDLDPELVTAVLLVESSARPWVRSHAGAIGLMQVMPHMMKPLGLAGNAATIESNVEAGCWILANNIRRLGEDRGILAYFWGSQIRGESYLGKVREARAVVRELRPS